MAVSKRGAVVRGQRKPAARRAGRRAAPWARPANALGNRSLYCALLLFALVSMVFLAMTSAAGATPPVVTIGTPTNPTYTTVEVTGTIDTHGEEGNWFFQISREGDGNWEYAFVAGSFGEPVQGTITGLTAGVTYEARLVAVNNSEGAEVVSDPSAPFTTEAVPPPSLTMEPATAISATSAHLTGTVEPNPPPGNPPASNVDWHFQCNPGCPGLAGGTVLAGATGAEQVVEASAVGLEPNTKYTVTLIGKNAGDPVESSPISFTTGEAAPEAQTLPAFAIRGGTEAIVGGTVNPHNADTTYWIEWGQTSTYGQKIPLTPVAIGSGGIRKFVTERLTGLSPSTVYHAQLIAKNTAGEGKGIDVNFETAPASDQITQGCANATLRVQNQSTLLNQCRAYEQVSPTDKNGFEIGGETNYQNYVAAEDGSGVAFESNGAFGDSKSSTFNNPFVSRRSPSGWTTHALAPPAPSRAGTESTYLSWYSSDLGRAIVLPPRGYHLAPMDSPGDYNLYGLDTTDDQLVTLNNTGPVESASVIGASNDAERVYFTSSRPLLSGAPEGYSTIYKWEEGQLSIASRIPPGDEPSPHGGSINNAASGHNFVSEDGSRLLFESPDESFMQVLYLRDGGETFRITPEGTSGTIVGATPDLSKIYFNSVDALAPGAVNGSFNLYRYDAGSHTIFLVAPGHDGSGGAGEVLGVSRDGSYVYFRSETQYFPDQGISGEPGGRTNLYLWHDGEIRFIAADEHAGPVRDLFNRYRVSPDGTQLSFPSESRMTAYDNTDATPGPGGQSRLDSEVYVYDAVAERLTCVSCNPSGDSPVGTAEGPDASSTIPAPSQRQVRNLQPGVGDDGHIFFETRDALVGEDVNGVNDVYEWSQGAVHLISSGTSQQPSFLASSGVDSRDVFFTTTQPLVPADRDALSDLYDARVEGGFPPPAKATLCEGVESCHGAQSMPPGFPDPSSKTQSPEGRANSRALRHRQALRRCKRKPKKKQRSRCKRAVNKQFQGTSKGKA